MYAIFPIAEQAKVYMQERLLVVKRRTTTVIRCRLPNLQVQTSSFKRGYPENDSGRRHMRKVCISLATVILVILGTNLAIAQYKQTILVAMRGVTQSTPSPACQRSTALMANPSPSP